MPAETVIDSYKFRRPNPIERGFNRVFGWMVGAGLGTRYFYLLQVTGRKSGKLYSAPIELLVIDDRKFLVCPRGRAQWVRNAEASGQVWLKKGSDRVLYAIRAVPAAERPDLLRAYLDQFKLFVQRYFPVPAGSPAPAFVSIADRYPVFELLLSKSTG
jgi:deazaflavin-dependent oxidoreductase (nitroreductase family)